MTWVGHIFLPRRRIFGGVWKVELHRWRALRGWMCWKLTALAALRVYTYMKCDLPHIRT
jgi:hypothetical protein